MNTVESFGIAMPKYQKGDIVFASQLLSETAHHPCPDCLGSGKWKLETPSGQTFEVACQRCGRSYSHNGLTLAYKCYKASARRLTIGSLRLESDRYDHDSISYMCTETGIGSGTIWKEGKLFTTEEQALKAAQEQAAAENLKVSERPEEIRKEQLAQISIPNVQKELAHDSIWNAWWSYRHLREDLAEIIEEPPERRDEIIEAVQSAIDWEGKYREHPVLGRLLRAAEKAVRGDLSDLAAELEKFPNDLRFIADGAAA